MINGIKSAGVFVKDMAQAYNFYVNKLGFDVRMDLTMPNGYRWLEVAPKGSQTVIAISTDNDQQVGGIVNIILRTDDITATYADLLAKGVHFINEPKQQEWGDMMVEFTDPEGNTFMLLQENTAKPVWET